MNKEFSKQETFSTINAPSFMVGDDKWVDTSWHNDVTASAEMKLNEELTIRVWVADDDVNEREYAELPKYMVEVDDEDGDNILANELDGDYYIEANTEEELKQVVDKLVKKYGG